jgi:NAD(P)H-flavin reductase
MTTRRPKRSPLQEVTVVQRDDKTEDLAIIWISKPDGYTFKPGQYCTIGYDGIERAYSIASAPHEEHIELFVELVPIEEGGVLTPKLWNLYEGDKVTIRPRAKGIFTFKEEKPNQLLISTVTGVVPYVSFIRDYIQQGRSDHHFYVMEGASYQDEFVYDEEFSYMAKTSPELLTFVPTISRPGQGKNIGWEGDTGRVNNIVENKIQEFSLLPQDTMVYACGHPGMIEDVKEQLTPRGFDFLEERFWKDD